MHHQAAQQLHNVLLQRAQLTKPEWYTARAGHRDNSISGHVSKSCIVPCVVEITSQAAICNTHTAHPDKRSKLTTTENRWNATNIFYTVRLLWAQEEDSHMTAIDQVMLILAHPNNTTMHACLLFFNNTPSPSKGY